MSRFTLKIEYDPEPLNPREEHENLTTMVCAHRRYKLGDESYTDGEEAVRAAWNGISDLLTRAEAEKLAGKYWDEAERNEVGDDMELVRDYEPVGYEPGMVLEHAFDNVYVQSLYLYDHSGITISTTPFSCPWDSGMVGFCWVTRETIEREFGTDVDWEKKAQEIIDAEVKEYYRYLRGEVYGYVLEDEDGDLLGSCWGFDDYDYCLETALYAAAFFAEEGDRLEVILPDGERQEKVFDD